MDILKSGYWLITRRKIQEEEQKGIKDPKPLLQISSQALQILVQKNWLKIQQSRPQETLKLKSSQSTFIFIKNRKIQSK